MAIQKISANDDLAPDFETFGVMKKIAKQTLYIALGLSILAFIFGGGFISALLTFILSLFIILGIRFTFLQFTLIATKGRKEYDKVHNYYKELAIKNNINVSYEAPGIIIDKEARKIAFTIDPEQEKRVIICDFSDIRQWYSHESTVTNENYKVHSSGHISGGKTETTFTGMRVEINDPDMPLYSFWTANHNDSNLWMARLSSLING